MKIYDDLKNGNPSDTELLLPAIESHINVTGKFPWAVAMPDLVLQIIKKH